MQTIFYIFFRDSCWGKIYFPSSGNVFLNESFTKILLSNGHHHFTWKFLFTRGNRHCYEWRPIFKDKSYSCWWKLTLWLVETIFHWLIYFSRSPSSQLAETHFSVQKKRLFFIQSFLFFYWKPIFKLWRSYFKPLIILLDYAIFWISVSMEAVFPSNRNVFLNKFSIPLMEIEFLSIWNNIFLFRDFFLFVETGRSNFWKITLFLLIETHFLASGNHFFSSILRHFRHC